MRKFRFIFLFVTVLLITGACSRLERPTTNLNIYVRIPDQGTTKADTDVAPDNVKETRITDLRIWVYIHSADEQLNGRLLGFLAPTKLDYSGDAVKKFTIPLDKTLASQITHVDVYALANVRSAGLDMGNGLSPVNTGGTYKPWEELTASELEGILISGTAFGIKQNTDLTWGPNNTGVVDNQGLPFSAVGKDLSISGSSSELSVDAVELVRAVSKVQFIFSQIMDAQSVKPAEFTITGLKLTGSKLAAQEYIFPGQPYDGGYLANDLTFPVNDLTKASIAGATNPGGYEWQEGESAQAYRDRIEAGISAGNLTRGPQCYLRESDQRLEGVFSYLMGGETQEAHITFKMAEGEVFARNRSWIVYIYFNNDRMGLSVRLLTDWVNGAQYGFEAE